MIALRASGEFLLTRGLVNRDALGFEPLDAASGRLMSAAFGYQTLCQLFCRPEPRFRVECALDGVIRKSAQGVFAGINSSPKLAVPSLIALLTQARELCCLQNVGGPQQGTRQGINSSDMRQVEIPLARSLSGRVALHAENLDCARCLRPRPLDITRTAIKSNCDLVPFVIVDVATGPPKHGIMQRLLLISWNLH